MYHLSCLFSNDCDYNDGPNEPNATNATSSFAKPQSETLEKPQESKLNTASMYKENQYISNKGFVNELIFKHPQYSDELSNNITTNFTDIPLNSVCQTSADLPIANINVKYMLGKNTTMLRDE